MKKIFLALALVATSLATTNALAQGYVFGAVGSSDTDIDCEGAATCDTKGTAIKLGLGWDMGGWALEAAYAHFGKAKAADSGLSVDFKAQGLLFGAAYQAQLNNDWGLHLRGGLGYIKTSISASAVGLGSASDSDNNVAPYLGLGVNYAVSKATRLELGVDFTKGEYDGEKANIRALTLGVRHAF
jgi:OOP family OmpA-OmpF porin